MKLLLRHWIYTCIYCVEIFSWWNIPKMRSEAKNVKSVKTSEAPANDLDHKAQGCVLLQMTLAAWGPL